jgi:hypothetical protein
LIKSKCFRGEEEDEEKNSNKIRPWPRKREKIKRWKLYLSFGIKSAERLRNNKRSCLFLIKKLRVIKSVTFGFSLSCGIERCDLLGLLGSGYGEREKRPSTVGWRERKPREKWCANLVCVGE